MSVKLDIEPKLAYSVVVWYDTNKADFVLYINKDLSYADSHAVADILRDLWIKYDYQINMWIVESKKIHEILLWLDVYNMCRKF